jgi:16S rRNA (guanine966-N2)-methyltransferase
VLSRDRLVGRQLMRVVSGSARGKKLLLVPGRGTRPILDRVKTSLFDMLRPRIEGMHVLDLFAGSGSVGIEALSQGAAHCTFTDLGDQAVATIRRNLANTGFSDRGDVRQTDAFAFLRTTRQSFDLIFVAPPQYKNFWAESMRQIDARVDVLRGLTAESLNTDEYQETGLAIVQIHPKEYESLGLVGLREIRQKRYGNSLLVFYERSSGSSRQVESKHRHKRYDELEYEEIVREAACHDEQVEKLMGPEDPRVEDRPIYQVDDGPHGIEDPTEDDGQQGAM